MMELPEDRTTEGDGDIPLGKKEREDLLTSVMNRLKEESDKVLKSVAEVIEDLKQNAGMREAVESFYENGWAFIQKTRRSENEIKFEGSTLSSTLALAKPKNFASRLDHETHPMSNELVLKKIFEYCSVNNLKNCRLVSTKWRDLSLSSWRGNAILQVNRLVKAGEVKDFIEDGSEFQKIAFQKYRLFYAPRHPGFKSKKAFLNTFASSIQCMHLSSRDLKSMFSLLTKLPELRDVTLEFCVEDLWTAYETIIVLGGVCPFQDLQAATSKLRKLDLQLIFKKNGSYDHDVIFPWREVFEKVPSIESLRVKYERKHKRINYDYSFGDSDSDEGDMHITPLEDIMKSVCEIRKKGNLTTLNLEELDILDTQHPILTHHFSETVATSIIESQLPLQRLDITLVHNVSYATISKLFEAHAETLKYMKCNCDVGVGIWFILEMGQWPETPPYHLPSYLPSEVSLPSLKEIEFFSSCVWAFYVLASLDLPNLESLTIGPKDASKKNYLGNEFDLGRTYIVSKSGQPFEPQLLLGTSFFPNLKTFFYDGRRCFNAAELQSLRKAMPNVTDLRIPLCEIEAFPNVYELWPGLQSLHILLFDRTYVLFDDYAITGLPLPYENGDGAASRKPNITNLKDLRIFVLEGRLLEDFPRPRGPLITDLSAVYGFLQLPKLRILRIETELCKFSPRIHAALESHVLEMKVKCPETVKENEEGYDNDDDISSCSDESEIEFTDPQPFQNEVEEDADDITSGEPESDVEIVISEDGDDA